MIGKALLALEDGSVFPGSAVGAAGSAAGELVFNTAMTGYQEILTDPSYCRQIITMTHPHIGNTGTNDADNESHRVWAAGLVVRDPIRAPSSWRSELPLGDFLRNKGVVAIADIDTRQVTRILRERGAMGACVATVTGTGAGAWDDAVARATVAAGDFPGLQWMDLASEVSCATRQSFPAYPADGSPVAGAAAQPRQDAAPRFPVVAYDFGIKRAILRMLRERGCDVTLVPARTPAAAALALKPAGIFLSNGPGDPQATDYAIATIREFLRHGVPLFGICLGCQLLALACGAETVKMHLGHHGANHPVQDLRTGQVMITSQNHGFAIHEPSLPDTLAATHRSLFDGTLQGIVHRQQPAFGFQGHPEASPGPHDISPLFDEFIALMTRRPSAPAVSPSR